MSITCGTRKARFAQILNRLASQQGVVYEPPPVGGFRLLSSNPEIRENPQLRGWYRPILRDLGQAGRDVSGSRRRWHQRAQDLLKSANSVCAWSLRSTALERVNIGARKPGSIRYLSEAPPELFTALSDRPSESVGVVFYS